MRLAGKVALVTGAGRGIGQGIALGLAREGASVVINDINEAGAEAVADEVRALGQQAISFRADVTSIKEVNDMVLTAIMRFGKIDILVNNAGYSPNLPFMESTEEDWDKLLGLNLKGVFVCCRAVLEDMIKRESGKIVNISSDAARIGINSQTIYTAAKGGVISFTKSLAREMARYHINVNSVSPGVVDTELSREVARANPQQAGKLLKTIPWRRLASPDDIAGAVVFLATDEADYITGQILSVNGGGSMVN